MQETEAQALPIAVEVDDGSILAHKAITVRPITKAKLKHIRAAQRVWSAGKDADVNDMICALAGFLVGWSEEEVAELTFDEMLLMMDQINEHQQAAVPNGSGSRSPRPSPRVMRGRVRTG